MKIKVLNVRLPDEILEWIDALVARRIFKSRSEAIREFSREYLMASKGAAVGR
ncbi:MAG: ribbon-helix-helix domain-containing protein [archaeon]